MTTVSPENACYFKIGTNSGTVVYGTTYNHDICINLHWDGEKDGQYEPYKEYTYALDDSITLRGIPKVDANGNLYYDGDEYLPDGTVNRRYGEVTFDGSNDEVWNYSSTNNRVFTVLPDAYGPESGTTVLLSNRLIGAASAAAYSAYINGNKTLVIYAPSTITSVAEWKTWLASNHVSVVYELETATTETADPYQETQIVDDFGTEEFVLADGTFPVPVGHDTMYQNNLRAKLEMSPDSPDGDGLYVVQQESGENTYVPLASTATIQDILARLTALENA